MTDIPAAAVTAAAEAIDRVLSTEYDPSRPDALGRAAVEAAAPHLTPPDPATETEGFRAYQAGLAAGRAEGAAAERQRIVRLLETEAPRYALGATALRRIAADLLEDTP